MTGPRRLLLCALPVLAVAVSIAASASTLDEARALMLAGERDRARVGLDSLLAWGAAVESDQWFEASLLRARLEEDGAAYAAALRELLEEQENPRREASLRLSLGQVLFAEGRMEEALTEFREVRRLGREEAGSLWVGLTAFVLGDGPTAREALDRAAGSGNHAVRQRALIALGDTERLTGVCDEAIQRYRDAREVKHGARGWWAVAALAEALCLEDTGDRDGAEQLLQSILRLAPGSYEAPLAREQLLAWEVEAQHPAPAAVPADEIEGPAGPVVLAGYAVQVGAFTLADNAKALADAVESRGFSPVRVARGEDDLHRVMVGRFESREAAEAYGDSLGITLGVGFSVVAERED